MKDIKCLEQNGSLYQNTANEQNNTEYQRR